MSDAAPLMPVVILAGGLATRMRPITATIPKALIEIEGKPFFWHQLQLLKANGAQRVIALVGYLGEQVQERFGDGSDMGLSIDYSFDGPQLLGTAGAIRRALPLLPEQFFVLYGDSYLPCDYQRVEHAFRESGQPGLMTVYLNEGRYDQSNVEYDRGRIVNYDKRQRTPAMRHIDYGLGAFDRSVFAALPENDVRDLERIYRDLVAEGRLAAFESRERFYEIGSPEGLKDTTEFLRRKGGTV